MIVYFVKLVVCEKYDLQEIGMKQLKESMTKNIMAFDELSNAAKVRDLLNKGLDVDPSLNSLNNDGMANVRFMIEESLFDESFFKRRPEVKDSVERFLSIGKRFLANNG